ncbi:MAG: hypothetical protein ACO4AM_00290 [Candidatus Nanopelagicaceae bacterium]
MAKLRLKQPTARSSQKGGSERYVVEVAVAAPVPHLEGIYSYRNDGHPVNVGSVVEVPFGGSETHGFVIAMRPEGTNDSALKKITDVLHLGSLFSEVSLRRFQGISERYGASLFSILSFATPHWSRTQIEGKNSSKVIHPTNEVSAKDRNYLTSLFPDLIYGNSKEGQTRDNHLLLPIGVPWERVAISLFLAHQIPTLIIVPTERSLSRISHALKERGFENFISLTSSMKKSERIRAHQELLLNFPMLVVGTRTAALAPFDPSRIIIVDPSDENYEELRAPHWRADDLSLWSTTKEIFTLSHNRDLSLLASDKRYVAGTTKGKYQFIETAMDRVIADLKSLIRGEKASLAILVSVTDRSFGNGLICKTCHNRTHCSCGFPLLIPRRGESPRCSHCFKDYSDYRCHFCSGTEIVATKVGSEALALTIAKSVKGSRVHLSNSSEPRVTVTRSYDHDIVIATHGLEPRVADVSGKASGYDIIVMLGGRAAFSGSSLSRADRIRRSWGRLLGLAHPSKARFLVDLESQHPEFQELKRTSTSHGLDLVLRERRELNLPPISTLVELKGEESALQQLRKQFLGDHLFTMSGHEIFPVHQGRMVMRVKSECRTELLRLLQSVTRIRSAKRLSVVSYRIADNVS